MKLLKKSCGFIFCGAFFFGSFSVGATSQKTKKKSAPMWQNSRQSAVMLDALEFLNSEGRAEDFEILQNKIIPLAEIRLIEKAIQIHLSNRSRNRLQSLMSSIADHFHCRTSGKRSQICTASARLWVDNLDSIYFFEESPGKILQAQRMLEVGKCTSALSLLKEVESREGFPRPVVDTARAIAECLKNNEMVLLNQKRADELRLFN